MKKTILLFLILTIFSFIILLYKPVYTIEIKDTALATLQTQEEAEEVVRHILDGYTPKNDKIISMSITEDIKIKRDSVLVSETPDTIQQATKNIISKNNSKTPAFYSVIKTEKTEKIAIPYETELQNSDKIYRGISEIDQKGKDGVKEVKTVYIFKNGTQVDKHITSEKTLKKPKNAIKLVGVKPIPEAERNDLQDCSNYVHGTGMGVVIAKYACKHVGLNYVWGGSSLTTGADCGGFVMAIFDKFGYSAPRGEYGSHTVSLENARAGDIVDYPGHVAIYIGDGKVVHEMNQANGCCIREIDYCGTSYTIYRIVD